MQIKYELFILVYGISENSSRKLDITEKQKKIMGLFLRASFFGWICGFEIAPQYKAFCRPQKAFLKTPLVFHFLSLYLNFKNRLLVIFDQYALFLRKGVLDLLYQLDVQVSGAFYPH